MEYSEKLAAKYGIKPAPQDHPIYSEGSTIQFIQSRPARPLKPLQKPADASKDNAGSDDSHD
ncbi:MAG: hypothetical protein EB015_20365 [Methylocystaceae bacterium]|nr:hypothetical protein [Methylocystaceae bacterium]